MFDIQKVFYDFRWGPGVVQAFHRVASGEGNEDDAMTAAVAMWLVFGPASKPFGTDEKELARHAGKIHNTASIILGAALTAIVIRSKFPEYAYMGDNILNGLHGDAVRDIVFASNMDKLPHVLESWADAVEEIWDEVVNGNNAEFDALFPRPPVSSRDIAKIVIAMLSLARKTASDAIMAADEELSKLFVAMSEIGLEDMARLASKALRYEDGTIYHPLFSVLVQYAMQGDNMTPMERMMFAANLTGGVIGINGGKIHDRNTILSISRGRTLVINEDGQTVTVRIGQKALPNGLYPALVGIGDDVFHAVCAVRDVDNPGVIVVSFDEGE